MTAKLTKSEDSDGIGWFFDCPGCGSMHRVPISGKQPLWSFNNDIEKPTFHPSLLVSGTVRMTDDEYNRVMAGEKIEPKKFVCHSFVEDGKIKFLADCTHSLAGQTVEMLPAEP